MDAGKSHYDLSDRTIVTARVIDAPRALVFDAFTDPDHLAKWWGPNGFSLTTQSFAMRPGGEWRFVMHGPDGRDYQNRITFDEIVRPERIAYHHSGGGDTAHIQFDTTITFEDLGGRTRLTLTALFPNAEMRDRVIREHKADEGGRQTVGRLADYIAGEYFAVTRSLDAPRDLVWKAWTDGAHLAKWWGPKGTVWIKGAIDLKPGGLFHYAMKHPNGLEMWGRFVFHAIVPPERLEFVSSFSDPAGAITRGPFFADWPQEIYNTLTLTEADGKTLLTLRAQPVNAGAAERERFRSMRQSMTQGFSGSFEQLEAHLKRLLS